MSLFFDEASCERNEAPAPVKWTHLKGNPEHIELLQLTDWPMEDTFALFGKHLGVQVIYDGEVRERIQGVLKSTDFNEMSWRDALHSFAVSNGYEIVEEGPAVLRVVRRLEE